MTDEFKGVIIAPLTASRYTSWSVVTVNEKQHHESEDGVLFTLQR